MNYDVRPLYWHGLDPIDDQKALAACPTEEARKALQREFDDANEKLGARKQNMSGPRELRLPPLLEQRRLEWMIPDQVFYYPATFDWIGLYQIPPVTGQRERAGAGLIIKPPQTRDIEHRSASRGIVITAGLPALDYLYDHGMELGNIVRFVRIAPWRQVIGQIGKEEFELLTVKPGDICACEDHYLPMQQNGLQVVATNYEGPDGKTVRHQLMKRDGTIYGGRAMPPDQGDF